LGGTYNLPYKLHEKNFFLPWGAPPGYAYAYNTQCKLLLYTGVKVSRNTIPGPGNLSLDRYGCKIVDFTAGTYVPGPRKLATFAIVIRQLVSHSNFTFLQS